MTKPIPNFPVVLEKRNGRHYYRAGNATYGGVTSVLSVIAKPALINWAKREALASVEGALTKRLNDFGSNIINMDR